MVERDPKVQTSSYKINKSWGSNLLANIKILIIMYYIFESF